MGCRDQRACSLSLAGHMRCLASLLPELANHYRDQLRGAKDRTSMLAIASDIIINVEEIAGPDRADGLSERLAMMLPPE